MLACLGMACLTPMERIVLAVIASFDGERGAFPSLATLADVARVNKRRVRAITASLREHGVLSTVRRQRDSNIYLIDYGHSCPVEFQPDRNLLTGRNSDLDRSKSSHLDRSKPGRLTGRNSTAELELKGSRKEVEREKSARSQVAAALEGAATRAKGIPPEHRAKLVEMGKLKP